MHNWLGNDGNWIVAGLAAAITVPLLSLAAGMPFWIAAIIALLVFAGLVILLAPRRLFEGVDLKRIGSGRVAFARDLLEAAVPFAERLETAADAIVDKSAAAAARHLAEIAADVFRKVEAKPESANAVRRFLSYYLPRAAEVAEGFAVIEAKRVPDPKQLGEVRGVLVKLEEAFIHYADSLVDEELGTLDTDLRLIQASLKEDIGR
ncbi:MULTISPECIES: 5-bromo-4-chloroindolyl phosphate hydrolysis family protein [unclassified Rhizobium]|uniref:5-bromo-4-chloroindolyl phosphate hydrolysis family protein n=1 Tax=unclassified Rhizobium TaxID=2613769 RepID=UPI0007EBE3BD|nr:MULTISPECIES: 5-bromo-4-chloroindolyl phosphate hydrolysis family protein [unclassified Rhizobium]ANK85567.1 5-bromo-4-chloroindolyl phosphate hydrolysis protein [Rhizobium sp. N731]ANL15814.1 5-bromo-4-chloroindolyl phosphate hydrolysis protein [Rhizobium sp. N1314]